MGEEKPASDSPTGEADSAGVLLCPHCNCPVPRGDGRCLCPACGSSFRIAGPVLESTLDAIGVLGRFQLQERVGVGAFGAVWRARDTQLGRLVAVKIPHPSLGGAPGALERLNREARAVAQLRHPGIVRLYEVVEVGCMPVLVSDFINGITLKDLLSVRRVPIREAAQLVADVAEALDCAHTQGLVHRDIKPGNIMIDYGPSDRQGASPASSASPAAVAKGQAARLGRPVIVDFGLALREEAELVMTVEGQLLGTPAYMSPEQAAGRGHYADRRSDVYSLGVVLYELLCGEVPFRGSKAMIVHQVLHEEPRPPRRLNDKIPRDLETICLKAMAKQPAWRYATCAELADDLRRFVKGEPIRARPVSRAERLWRWARRNPALALTGAVAVAACLALIGVSISLNIQQGRALRESRRFAATMALERGLAECDQGNVGPGMLWLARSLESVPADEDALRRVIALNLAAWRPWLGPVRTPLAHASPVRALALSGDGNTVLTASIDQTARLWDARTGTPLGPPLAHAEEILAVALSPDGRTAATACADGNVRLWDTATRQPLGRPLGHPDRVHVLAFRPDGQTLLTGCGDRNAYLWDVASGERSKIVFKHPVPISAAVFSPDGKTVLTGAADKQARLWHVDTGEPLPMTLRHPASVTTTAWRDELLLTGGLSKVVQLADAKTMAVLHELPHRAHVLAAALSPDGRLVFTSSSDQSAQLWDAATGKPRGPPLRHWPRTTTALFTRDDSELLLGGGDGCPWIREAPRGSLRRELRTPNEPVKFLVFSRDGRRLLSGSGHFPNETATLNVWDADTGNLVGPAVTHSGLLLAAAISSDGRTMVSGATDKHARLIDVATGKIIQPALEHEWWVYATAFSPDGKYLLTGSKDGARLWDLQTAKQCAVFPHRQPVETAAFSPDGRYILTGSSDQGARLWHVSNTQPPRLFPHADQVSAVAFHPDGKLALTASVDKTAKLWDIATGEAVGAVMAHQDRILGAVFSADGKWVATCSADKTARVWDAATGKPVTPPLSHKDSVKSVAFHPDGSLVLTGSADRTARLWETVTGKPIGPALLHDGAVNVVVFHPNGTLLATGSEDQTTRIWTVPVPVAGEPATIRLWVEVMTDTELDANGASRTLEMEAWTLRSQRLRELGGPPLQPPP